jgi:hypothetical protein
MQPLLPFGGAVFQRRGVAQKICSLPLIPQNRGELARFSGIDEKLCGLCRNGFVERHGFRIAPFAPQDVGGYKTPNLACRFTTQSVMTRKGSPAKPGGVAGLSSLRVFARYQPHLLRIGATMTTTQTRTRSASGRSSKTATFPSA